MSATVLEGDVLAAASTPSGRPFTGSGFQLGWMTAIRPDGDAWIWRCSQCGAERPADVAHVLSQGETATCSEACTTVACSYFAVPQ